MKKISWLMLLYQLPTTPSTQRVYVWRKLKTLGALYLQHSACLLPDRIALRQAVDELRQEIESRKGEATTYRLQLTEPSELDAVIERFRTQSAEDYKEFMGRCDDFHAELKREREQKHFTFAELEENEVELAKLRTWLPKIEERDFFASDSRAKARQALAKCEKDFARYGTEVADAQGQRTVESSDTLNQRLLQHTKTGRVIKPKGKGRGRGS